MTTVSPEVIELKPCPFCGGRAQFVEIRRELFRHAVQCVKCDALIGGSAFKNDEYNAAVWNTRFNFNPPIQG